MRKIKLEWTEEEADGTPNEMGFETNDVNVAIEWLGKIERDIEKKMSEQEIKAEDTE